MRGTVTLVSRIWKEDTHETKVIADGLNNACSNGPVTEGEEVLWLRHTAFDEGSLLMITSAREMKKKEEYLSSSLFSALFSTGSAGV